jgi:tRNA1(Val) A37 N6-methylase TrmN6
MIGSTAAPEIFIHSDRQLVWALIRAMAPVFRDGSRVLEMGTGTGSNLIWLADFAARVGVSVSFLGADILERPLEIARDSAREYANMMFVHSDLFEGIQDRDGFDVILWNPPWFATRDRTKWGSRTNTTVVAADERCFVDPGYRRIGSFLKQAPRFLTLNGQVLVVFPRIHIGLLSRLTRAWFDPKPVFEYWTASFDIGIYRLMAVDGGRRFLPLDGRCNG